MYLEALKVIHIDNNEKDVKKRESGEKERSEHIDRRYLNTTRLCI